MKKAVRYVFRTVCIFLLLGVTYQFISVKIDDSKYPPIGEFVDIGGYKLHLYKTGIDSGPTIILDMGLGGNLLYWGPVQEELSKFATVVSYDRGGLGWSDKSPKKRTSQNITEELHLLLQVAKIPGPYILVGHSFAGLNARIFANKYPDEVLGVILVDSTHEEQIAKLPAQRDFVSVMLNHDSSYPILVSLARIGVTRIYNNLNYEYTLPDNLRDMIIARNSTSEFMRACINEWSMLPDNLEYVRKTGQNLYNKPLTVITAGLKPTNDNCRKRGFDDSNCQDAYDTWQVLQKDLVRKSTIGKQIIVEECGHNIPVDAPHAIVDAVKAMIKDLV